MHVSEGLTIEFGGYGRQIEPRWWSVVRTGLDDIARQIGNERGDLDEFIHGSSYKYESTYIIRLSFIEKLARPPWRMPPRIAKRDAIKLLMTIKGIFFLYKYRPRDFWGLIRIQNHHQMEIVFIGLAPWPAAWPHILPWYIPVPSAGLSSPWIVLEQYGRDLSDPSLVNEVRDALSWLTKEITEEGPDSGLLNKKVYYHAFVRLTIEPRDADRDKQELSRGDIKRLVRIIEEAFFSPHNYGPRELRLEVSAPQTNFWEITLEFVDSAQLEPQLRSLDSNSERVNQ